VQCYTYRCNYLAEWMDFVNVSVIATSLEDAVRQIDEWCTQHYCTTSQSATGYGPRPELLQTSQLAWDHQQVNG
jgi:hypothetical protein